MWKFHQNKWSISRREYFNNKSSSQEWLHARYVDFQFRAKENLPLNESLSQECQNARHIRFYIFPTSANEFREVSFEQNLGLTLKLISENFLSIFQKLFLLIESQSHFVSQKSDASNWGKLLPFKFFEVLRLKGISKKETSINILLSILYSQIILSYIVSCVIIVKFSPFLIHYKCHAYIPPTESQLAYMAHSSVGVL